jgi:hypothetical protein
MCRSVPHSLPLTAFRTTVGVSNSSNPPMSEDVKEDVKPALPVTTSIEPDFDPDQRAFYSEVLELLNRHSIPYVVSGAFALQHHTGIWRVTKDLDVFVTAATVPLALAALREDGFRCEITDPVWLAKAFRGDSFVDLITGMSNATLTVTDEWIKRGSPAIICDVQTRVLAPEELLASKLFVTRRERFDGADTAHVIYGTGGKLDWNRVLELAGDHWEILLWSLLLFRYVYPARTSYIPTNVWKQLIGNLQREIEHPNSSARFRGSLIDKNMFAIDLNEWKLGDVLSEYRERAPKIEEANDCRDNDCGNLAKGKIA